MYEDAHRAAYGVVKARQAARPVASRTTLAAIRCWSRRRVAYSVTTTSPTARSSRLRNAAFRRGKPIFPLRQPPRAPPFHPLSGNCAGDPFRGSYPSAQRASEAAAFQKEGLLDRQEAHIIRITRVIRKEAAVRVTTAEFIKNYGALADKALIEPVTITKNGRDRLVVVSAEEYSRLARRDRRVIRPEELTEEQVALIAKAEVPPEYAHLDAEVADWHP